MEYAVLSPSNKLICFDHPGQVAQYCSEQDTKNMETYYSGQHAVYEDMTPAEVGYANTVIGAEVGTCQIFKTKDVLEAMKKEDVEADIIEEMDLMFNSRRLNEEIDCPAYFSDMRPYLTALDISECLTGAYSCDNVGGSKEQENQSG